MSGLHHVELRPRSLRYYRRKDRKDCAESRRDAVIVDAKTRHRFKLDTKRMGAKSTFCAATNSLVRSPRQRCALWRAIVCLPLPRVRRTHSDSLALAVAAIAAFLRD